MSERLTDAELENLRWRMECLPVQHYLRRAEIGLAELQDRRASDAWRPIDTAPRDGLVWAYIWHGERYFKVIAKCFPNGVHDIRDESCVGTQRNPAKPPKHSAFWHPLFEPTAPALASAERSKP